MSGQYLWNDSKAIEIGGDASECHDCALSAIQTKTARKNPPTQEMRYRAHTQPYLSKLHQHLPILNLNRIDRELCPWIILQRSGRGVVLPAVPGADNLAPFN
jgi:hypothetical protein